jgi:transcription-repair coupling factor (superfamily II helicase)
MTATTTAWQEEVCGSAPVEALADAVARDRSAAASGVRGSSAALIAGGLAQRLGRTVLLVVAHLDEADDAVDDLESLAEAAPDRTAGLGVERFGALEVLPGESGVHLDLLAERLGVVQRLTAPVPAPGSLAESSGIAAHVIVAPVQALMQSVPEPDALEELTFTLGVGDSTPPGQLFDWLDRAGYSRQDAVEQPGDFATRGGIVDVYPVAGRVFTAGDDRTSGGPGPISPFRLDYFGDEIESIHRIDPDTMGSGEALASVGLVGGTEHQLQSHQRTTNLLDLLPGDAVPVLHETLELSEQARGYFERLTQPDGITPPKDLFRKLTARPHVELNAYSQTSNPNAVKVDLPIAALPTFDQDVKTALQELGDLVAAGSQVTVVCAKPAERDRLVELLIEHLPERYRKIDVVVGQLHRGFVWEADPLAPGSAGGQVANPPPAKPGAKGGPSHFFVPHHELFHRYETRRRVRQVISAASPTGQAGDAFLDLEVGDYVVHIDHGIAKFTGLKQMRARKNTKGEQVGGGEYLTLQFADQALLHVPAGQIDLIQKYVGGFQGRPPLSTLGGKRWRKQKDSVAEAVKDLAAELLRVQAARQTQSGTRFPADSHWQKEFEAEFPYDETDDQLAAIAAIKADMADDNPMDRLICGDVGFGKTEVALRAAFKCIEFGKQVAVLVPTTVLAEQHERTFRGRLADYPFRVESLSRFKTTAEQRKTLQAVERGEVDVLIGTHRILSDDVKFADLGMVIIDEEQRFGVEHKNKLLGLRLTAEILTLTATPIPRTLHMSMVGLRDISSLTTPPVDRRAIVTEVIPYSEERIKQALTRELSRDGQVYFVHNRVHNLQTIADDLRRLAPDARIVIGHGQMPPKLLEEVMLQFMRREADILVSTTIIESGIDIPTANTMFINQADHFGLAELHQLRGRVGRYKHRAYCYMLLPPDRTVNEVATKRLKAIENYSMLGAGFKIAMRDLEIRGAGNLLGAEQSGHIAAVGYEMYCVLLEQETKKLRNEPIIEASKCHLELPAPSPGRSIPKRYIASDKHRMEAYRRLTRVDTLAQLDAVVEDLTDAYGKPPAAAQHFIDAMEIRVAASTHRIDKIQLEGPDLIFTTRKPQAVEALFRGAPGRATVLDETTLYFRPPANYLDDPATLMAVLRKLLVRPLRGK